MVSQQRRESYASTSHAHSASDRPSNVATYPFRHHVVHYPKEERSGIDDDALAAEVGQVRRLVEEITVLLCACGWI